jgi:hypothetical protein
MDLMDSVICFVCSNSHFLMIYIVVYSVFIPLVTDIEYANVEYKSYDKLNVDSGGRPLSVDTKPQKSVSYGNIPHYSRTASTVSSLQNYQTLSENKYTHLMWRQIVLDTWNISICRAQYDGLLSVLWFIPRKKLKADTRFA